MLCISKTGPWHCPGLKTFKAKTEPGSPACSERGDVPGWENVAISGSHTTKKWRNIGRYGKHGSWPNWPTQLRIVPFGKQNSLFFFHTTSTNMSADRRENIKLQLNHQSRSLKKQGQRIGEKNEGLNGRTTGKKKQNTWKVELILSPYC